jgi:hypothetical protein
MATRIIVNNRQRLKDSLIIYASPLVGLEGNLSLQSTVVDDNAFGITNSGAVGIGTEWVH